MLSPRFLLLQPGGCSDLKLFYTDRLLALFAEKIDFYMRLVSSKF